MKTTKYILSALCLAALAAGCTKDTGMRTSSVEGLRLSVTAATPSTRTALHEDGLSLLWEEGDQLLLFSNTSTNTYTLTLDKSSLSEDGRKADFVASQAIPEGEYYVASSNALTQGSRPPRNIEFYNSDGGYRAYSYITVTDATRNTHAGGLKTTALLSDKITVSADAEVKDIPVSLKHYSTLLEFPLCLASNTTGYDVALNSVTIETSSGYPFFSRVSLANGALSSSNTLNHLSVVFGDHPVLSLGETYKVYMAVLAPGDLDLGSGDVVTVTVSTSEGDYTFTKPGRVLKPGYRYTLGDLNIDARPNLITNEAEWNQALAEGKSLLTLGANVELTSSATLPTDDVTVRGNYTLTVNVEGRTDPYPDKGDFDKLVDSGHNRAVIYPKLTLAGGADLKVKNGYLYIDKLEVGDGSELSGEGGRLVAMYALGVTPGARATIASSLVVSCSNLEDNEGTLTVDGRLYYMGGYSSSENALSADDLQLPYSYFEEWFTKLDVDLIGVEGSKNNIWASRNGNENVSGIVLDDVYNLTTPTDHVLDPYGYNTKACMIKSMRIDNEQIPGLGVHEFIAGNVYLGKFTGVLGMTGGATMTFGVPSERRLPMAIMGLYDYRPGTIDYINNEHKTGGTDSMDLYVALATKPYEVNTTDNTTYPGGPTGDLAGDPNIVAYGRLTTSEATDGYQRFRVELTYKDNNFTPSGDLYLLVTSTVSKDGPQYTGSTSSVLYLDELFLEF